MAPDDSALASDRAGSPSIATTPTSAAEPRAPVSADASPSSDKEKGTGDSIHSVTSSATAPEPIAGPFQFRNPARYQILAEYGRGGLGRIFRAHDKELGRDVALKELLQPTYHAELRFFREALITAGLEHLGIVPVHEAGRWPDGTPFYSMKLVAGRPLSDLLAEAKTLDQRLALLPHLIAVADAIAYAHNREIIHRDLKPSNVIVGEFGETIVIDWGLAKKLTEQTEDDSSGGPFRRSVVPEVTVAGSILGTPAYMPPRTGRRRPDGLPYNRPQLASLIFMRLLALAVLALLLGCGERARGPAVSTVMDTGKGETRSLAGAGNMMRPDAHAAALVNVPPLARRQDVIDVYHGVRVVDSYRWMEFPSSEREEWFRRQHGYARRVLDAIPGRDGIRDELREANREVEQVDVLKVVGDLPRIFAMRRGAQDESSKLVVRDGWDGPEHVLVDPNRRGDGRSHVTVDFAYPSPDGRHVAYGVSTAGSEDITLEIIEVDSGRVLPDRITRVRALPISWRPDLRSFFYARRAQQRPGLEPADRFKDSATYLHVIGEDPDTVKPVIAPSTRQLGLGPYDGTWVELSSRSRWALAVAQVGIVERAFFVAPLEKVEPGATSWRRVAKADEKLAGMLVHRDRLYGFTYANAPNYRIVSLNAKTGTLAEAKDFVAESSAVLVDFAAAQDAMYVVALDRGVHRLLRVPWRTANRKEVVLPFAGSIRKLVADPDHPGLLFNMEGWTRSPAWFQFDPRMGLRKVSIASSRIASWDGLIAEHATAVSRDGTEVPLSIIRRRDLITNGESPALLSGYGSYGLPVDPTYNPFTLTWVRWGGVYAFCHVRGGGERGKAWHLAGIKQNKENGVDDFIACAEYLIARRYTAPQRLTAIGVSAGGIVVGGAMTKRPELFKAAILRVAELNPLRDEVTEVGPAHVAEYGSVKVEAEFHSVLASDPYHRIRDSIKYPAVLLTVGLHDVRVPVWMPAKFAARLQATGRAQTTLLRIEADAGHGFESTKTQREEEYADIYAFALWQSGIEAKKDGLIPMSVEK